MGSSEDKTLPLGTSCPLANNLNMKSNEFISPGGQLPTTDLWRSGPNFSKY